MQRPSTGFCPITDGLSTPLPPTREWHASITPNLRDHLVAKLVKVSLNSKCEIKL
jgi:hypothetical protein